MPVTLGGPHGTEAPRMAGGAADLAVAGTEVDCLDIGLVNNMPDAALQATESQFLTLLAAAAGDREVRVRLYSLPTVSRGPAAAAHIAYHYAATTALGRDRLDALIVTGCEPRAPSLTEEPYWASLTQLIDWAEHNTVSTLWSCLAAHAAVLHLDGIPRQRLPQKRAGLYDCAAVATHPLLAGAPARLTVPHSRWNDLSEADLAAHGYEILTRSKEAGVDLFTKRWNSLFVFFQGHPEYDAEAIAREYRRDLARYLRGEQAVYPTMPHAYFDAATEAAFADIRRRATEDRAGVALRDLPRPVRLRPGVAEHWQRSVVPVFSNWLAMVAAARQDVP